MKNFKLSMLVILTSILMVFFSSCKKDNPEPDALDPNAISNTIKVLNTVQKSGNPPAPTSNAPSVIALNPAIKLKPGKTAFLGVLFQDAQNPVTGFYLQVNGANTYFQGTLPKNTNKANGKKSHPFNRKGKSFGNQDKDGDDDGLVTIPIEIPENSSLGTFCVTYCVVDDEGNISNIVETCIELTETGTDDTDLLGSDVPWNLKKVNYFEDGETSEEVVGQNYVQILNQCDKYTNRTDFFKMTLSEDGTAAFSIKAYQKEEDICANEVLLEETLTEDLEGYWAYEGESNTLILYLKYEDEEEGEFVYFEVDELTANKLTFKLEYDEDEIETYYFEK